ncbi:MAG TPA: alginate export family protein [Blastocatellia bacterium]|nr:alginate export family protein [Blastocatellia bacterium]
MMSSDALEMKSLTRLMKSLAMFCLPALMLTSVAVSAIAQISPARQVPTANKPPDTSAKPQAQPKPDSTYQPIKLGGVTFSGSLRVRLESWDWFDTPAADGNYTFGAAQLRLSLSQQRERLDWQVEGEFPWLINLPKDAIALAPQGQLGFGASYFAASGTKDASAILKQAFVRFKGLAGDKASSLRVGRFEFVDGTEVTPKDPTLATLKRDSIGHRLIGPFGFTHIGRSFDGVQYIRNTKDSNFTLLGARVTEGAFQLNANREMDVDFYYGAFTKPLAGKSAQSELRAFALHYHDGRGAVKTDNRPLAVRAADGDNLRLTTAGGSYISAVKTGAGMADFLLWGAGQFGSWGRLDHRAGAVAAEAGYTFAVKTSPWVRVGYFRSTGDGNPADGDHTTFFQVLPTPRVYARFPFYNLMNNEDVFAQLRLKLHARVSLRGDAHHLRLSNARDLWYVGGGAFQDKTFGYVGRPGGGKTSLGTVFDLSADFNVTQTTVLTFYASGVRGGGVQGFTYPTGGNNPAARFAYFELSQRF